MKRWFALRDAPNANTDENYAMSRVLKGPFFSENDATQTAIALIEEEIRWWKERGDGEHVRVVEFEQMRDRMIDGEKEVRTAENKGSAQLRFMFYSTGKADN